LLPVGGQQLIVPDIYWLEMNIRIWLGFVLSTSLKARDLITTRSGKINLSDDAFLDILGDLMSEPDFRTQNIQIKNCKTADQILSFSSIEQYELVGYEFNRREECKEVFRLSVVQLMLPRLSLSL
jgi:hypothetical protein